jgi:predicted Rossmann fold flavoprotein
METPRSVAVIGGGAAGYFAAIAAAEANPNCQVVLYEKSGETLGKVRISGGGRCNVTHACFSPQELVGFYPRGGQELLGPFHRFMTGDTLEWFADRGVELKIESDNRIFPVTNQSQTIIDCLETFAERAGVMVKTRHGVQAVEPLDLGRWRIVFDEGGDREFDAVLLAPGSSRKMWDLIRKLGHTIVAPVPSLFTFVVKDIRISGLEGISLDRVRLSIPQAGWESEGPFLITHVGMSGPAVLRLSAFAARWMAEAGYRFSLEVNFVPDHEVDSLMDYLNGLRKSLEFQRRKLTTNPVLGIPLRLWKSLCAAAKIPDSFTWSDAGKPHLRRLSEQLTQASFAVSGKNTFKDEFVTAGGVELAEIDFKTFGSRLLPNLYLAGEVLNIDAVTGGFNFQAAWTGGWIAGHAMAHRPVE